MNYLKPALITAGLVFIAGCVSSYSKAVAAERTRSDRIYAMCMDEVKTRLKMGFEVKPWEEEIAYCEAKSVRKKSSPANAVAR